MCFKRITVCARTFIPPSLLHMATCEQGEELKIYFLTENVSSPHPSMHQKMRRLVCAFVFSQAGGHRCDAAAARPFSPCRVAVSRRPRGVAVPARRLPPVRRARARPAGAFSAAPGPAPAATRLPGPAPRAWPPTAAPAARGGDVQLRDRSGPFHPKRSARPRAFQHFRNTTRRFTTAISLQAHPA